MHLESLDDPRVWGTRDGFVLTLTILVFDLISGSNFIPICVIFFPRQCSNVFEHCLFVFCQCYVDLYCILGLILCKPVSLLCSILYSNFKTIPTSSYSLSLHYFFFWAMVHSIPSTSIRICCFQYLIPLPVFLEVVFIVFSALFFLPNFRNE